MLVPLHNSLNNTFDEKGRALMPEVDVLVKFPCYNRAKPHFAWLSTRVRCLSAVYY